MMMEIFTVLDAVADRYLEPFFAENCDTALRGFREICNKEDHQFFRHAEDYFLYHIGSFNAEIGELIALEPRKLAGATQMISVTQGPPEPFRTAVSMVPVPITGTVYDVS